MKKTVIGIVACLLVLALCGCEEAPAEVNYTQCQLVPGTLEAGLLQAEPGNYREEQLIIPYFDFVEIETGYFRVDSGKLYYADKTDLHTWMPLCNDPDCAHAETSNCTSLNNTGAYLKGGRLYFLMDAKTASHLTLKAPEMNGSVLCSMAFGGSDLKLEHAYEEAMDPNGGGTHCWYLVKDAYMGGTAVLNTDGSKTARLWHIGKDGARILLEKPYDDTLYVTVMPAAMRIGMRGDTSFMTDLIDGNMNKSFCWFHNGEMMVTYIDELPFSRNAYFSGSTLRGFVTNDGYYDYNLLTGESTKLADAQLENSSAIVMQPNCIFESTMFFNPDPEIEEAANQSETHSLRLFDGAQWHDVILPQEILDLAPTTNLTVEGLFTDRVLFSFYQGDGLYTLYQMMLDSDTYALESCGSWINPSLY